MVLIGIIGLLVLSAAWIYETYHNFKEHKSLIDLKFAYIYLVGNILLLAHAIQIADPVFTILGFILTFTIATEIITAKFLKKE